MFTRFGQILSDAMFPELTHTRFSEGSCAIRQMTMKSYLLGG